MATIVLQVAGAAIGGAIGGPFGAAIGRAVGAAAGYAIDQKIFEKDQVITGPRLAQSRVLTSNEGAPVPRVYGRTQIGGQIIWATRFEEVQSQTTQGGKGGQSGQSKTVTEYSYNANFAVGICAGPVSRIGRIWADGKELDLPKFKHRIYHGSQVQQSDPLIEALQSPGNTPAYRGLAYVVFEDFPLGDFGNRIPQMTFEVIRTIGEFEQSIKSVCVIPGSTAFGYSPEKLVSTNANGDTITHNRHVLVAQSDWSASIDELQALCPNLKTVSLIVAWFGDDLRVENCGVKPGVERLDIDADGHPWMVSGINPASAHQISKISGRPAYGSTPTDKSVIEAITDLRSRGLKTTFYPFLMMDIPPGNVLPNPEGDASQPAFPWRGRITCYPAIGQPGTVDQSATATSQIVPFTGDAGVSEFSPSGDTINFTGANQWTY
ncbi:MAG: glycine zipper domain-containing protein, partial [Rhizobiaceae bacterium]|nr:glycine zipper domain-containing protein [Rhizobiaceae bacterium]